MNVYKVIVGILTCAVISGLCPSHSAFASNDEADEDAVKELVMSCGGLLVGNVTPRLAARVRARVPLTLLSWQAQLMPSAPARDLEGFYARVPRLVPQGLLERVLSSPSRLNLSQLLGPLPGGMPRAKDFRRLQELHRVLEHISELTEEIHGPDSVEFALAEFSLAIFYNAGIAQQFAITYGSEAYPQGAPTVAGSNFDALASEKAHDAAVLLDHLRHPLRWIARFHEVKQLYQRSELLARENQSNEEGQAPSPLPGFEPQSFEAAREREALIADLESAAVSQQLKDWMRLQLDYLQISREELLERVGLRGTTPALTETREARRLARSEQMLSWVMARPLLFNQLVVEAGDGVLAKIIARLRLHHHFLTLDPSVAGPGPLGRKLFELEMELYEGSISSEDLFNALVELGYSPKSPGGGPA